MKTTFIVPISVVIVIYYMVYYYQSDNITSHDIKIDTLTNYPNDDLKSETSDNTEEKKQTNRYYYHFLLPIFVFLLILILIYFMSVQTNSEKNIQESHSTINSNNYVDQGIHNNVQKFYRIVDTNSTGNSGKIRIKRNGHWEQKEFFHNNLPGFIKKLKDNGYVNIDDVGAVTKEPKREKYVDDVDVV
jgi:preprotein translocase subunit YajC